MREQSLFHESSPQVAADILPSQSPFIWPEARFHTGQAEYANVPPASELLTQADLVSGVVVGAAEGTVGWLHDVLNDGVERHISIVLVLYPASPTREEHLKAIHDLRNAASAGKSTLDVRVLLMDRHFGSDCARVPLPPTVIQAHCSTGETVMSIGSVGDFGHDHVFPGSFNLVFRPDDAVRDLWRKWFQFVVAISVPLSQGTLHIPRLVPAEGQPEAALLWQEFEAACRKAVPVAETAVKVNAETGETESDAEGHPVVPWDGGKTALDPLAQVLQKVYADGWLVTVDEATRIKPLAIPVKAKLLGQESERVVGAVKQKQSFTLQVLGDDIDKAIEKCRKVTDLIDVLTFPLSQGNRWLPAAARSLLEKELNARNEEGRRLLCTALGGTVESPGKAADTPEQKAAADKAKDGWVKRFVAERRDKIREDLNGMYRQLGQGSSVPEDRLQSVLDEVETRLVQALTTRITPRAVYNRIGPPDLTAAAPDENWSQPLALLLRSARTFRESVSDARFSWRLSGLAFTEEEYTTACDVFGDAILAHSDMRRAKAELAALEEISAREGQTKGKCLDVWSVIKGKGPVSKQPAATHARSR